MHSSLQKQRRVHRELTKGCLSIGTILFAGTTVHFYSISFALCFSVEDTRVTDFSHTVRSTS